MAFLQLPITLNPFSQSNINGKFKFNDRFGSTICLCLTMVDATITPV